MRAIVFAILVHIFISGCDSKADKGYEAFKCAKVAYELGDSKKAEIANLYTAFYLKDVPQTGGPARYAMVELGQRYQDDLQLYKYQLNGQHSILLKVYGSSKCQEMYDPSEIQKELKAYEREQQPAPSNIHSVNAKPESENGTFEEIFASFNQCEFPNVSYNVSTKETAHPYFKQTNTLPFKIEDSLAYYKVDEYLFGIHISELILPVTWNFHSVTFDLPIDEVRSRLTAIFGDDFEAAHESDSGRKPVLMPERKDPTKTVLFCDEIEYLE